MAPLSLSYWRRCVCALLASCALPALAQPAPLAPETLPPSVNAALAQARVPASALAVLVMDAGDNAQVYATHRAQAPVNPASVMKLVTTYAALDLLGTGHTWTTPVYTDGPVKDGVLQGNLYLQGGGDPKLVTERLWLLMRRIQGLGLRRIAGDIVLDRRAFALPPLDPGAFDGEPLRPYNATPDALLVNFKSVVLTFQPDGANGVARVISEPPMAGLAIDATVPLARVGAGCGDWRSGLQARFDDANSIRFEGRYPQSCGELKWPVAYQDPASYASRAMEGLWRASGGAITGHARPGLTPPGATLLHEAASLPLSDIITDVNQWSNNVMAQQVYLTLGRLVPTPAPQPVMSQAAPGGLMPMRPARFERSREVVENWWKRTFGIRSAMPVMDNGSGLSREERITPEALANLLRHASRHPQGERFASSLSVAGVNGTAARMARAPGSAARGNAQLKTGTLKDVTGIAGYVNAANGARYVVVGFVNHPNAPAARPALEALVEWTAAQQD